MWPAVINCLQTNIIWSNCLSIIQNILNLKLIWHSHVTEISITTDRKEQVMWQYLTWPFGSGELKKMLKCIVCLVTLKIGEKKYLKIRDLLSIALFNICYKAAWVNNKGHVHIRVSCDQQLLIVYKQISYGQIVYQLFKTSWILN
jgi:hypothetical protein